MKSRISILATLVFLIVGLTPHAAVMAEPFTDGKTIYILAHSPGGGYDAEARLLARHLPRFLSGKPSRILVQNMPGARGVIQLTHFYQRIKPDGLTYLVTGSSQTGSQTLGEDVKFDVKNMPMLYAHSLAQVDLAHRNIGVKDPKDLLRVDPSKFIIAGGRVDDSSFFSSALGLDILGVKGYRWVVGYGGTAAMKMAIEREEATMVQAGMHHILGAAGAFYEEVQKGTLVPLWQSGLLSKEGEVVRMAGTDVPTFSEIHQRLRGKPPSGPAWEGFKLFGPVMRSTSRVLALPPRTPADRVERLRKVFWQLYQDPQFTADFVKIFGHKPSLIPGEDADAIMKQLADPGPGVSYVKELLARLSKRIS
jgi:tripartite-type tricarboxylate transporter receptor subunit TctC